MNTVTFQGTPLHLTGELPLAGQPAPDFNLVDKDLHERRLRDYAGKTLVLVSVPSLDTPVCDMEGRHFNEEAVKLSDKVQIAVVSMDLPFAQSRWCGAANATRLETLSDYKEADFGRHYGVLIKELHLLARAVFVVDGQGILTYVQLVPEITTPPEYAPVFEAIKKTLK